MIRRTGNPGGEPGWVRKRFTADFLTAFHEHFRKEGKRVIAKVARQQPAAYLRCLTMLVPKEMKVVEHQSGIKAMTDEQLDEALAALRQLLADREAQAQSALAAAGSLPPALPQLDVIGCRSLGNKGQIVLAPVKESRTLAGKSPGGESPRLSVRSISWVQRTRAGRSPQGPPPGTPRWGGGKLFNFRA